MTSIEAFARKGEKNMLKNMFKEDGASSDDSMSDCESDNDEKIRLNCEKGSVHGTSNGSFVSDDLHTSPVTEANDDSSFNDTSDVRGISILDANDSETTTDFYHSISNLFTISLRQERKKGIAHQLWPAATHLSQYIERNISTLYPDCRPENTGILELGAGIGLCGLVCSALKFKKVIVTDLPLALDILNSNIAMNTSKKKNSSSVLQESNLNTELNVTLNSEPNSALSDSAYVSPCPDTVPLPDAPAAVGISAKVLSWGNHEELVAVMKEFDTSSPVLVIAADCVYWEILFKPLCDTLRELVTEHKAEIIMSHVRRWKKDEKFFKLCRKSMTVELLEEIRELVPAEHTGIPTREIKRIYRIKAKLTA